MSVAGALMPLVDFVFPPRCPLCGAGITAQGGRCAPCWGELAIPGEPCCATCQRPMPGNVGDEAMCAPCLTAQLRHAGIAAATLYNEPSRKLVLAFKHGRRIALAPLLARLIVPRLRGIDASWTIVPVPLHRWRLWQRGFNQAALLARELARATGAELALDGLVRTKPTPKLGGLGRSARARALSGAIVVDRARLVAIAGRKVLLVDDVLTSGATTDACTRVLLRSGAERVAIACFARVLDEAL